MGNVTVRCNFALAVLKVTSNPTQTSILENTKTIDKYSDLHIIYKICIILN